MKEQLLDTPVLSETRKRSSLGAVYTPAALADWVAGQLLDVLDDAIGVVLDPACGEGSLLAAVQRRAPGRFELIGYDLDATCVAVARDAVADAEYFVLDTLVDDWAGIGPSRPVAAIVNPPWGAAVPHAPADLRARGYRLASGQYDSYELFCERLVRDLPRGSTVAAIVPDSVFLPEHAPLRNLLLSQTTLLTLARLGEGLFPDVYRGVAVAILRTSPPQPAHRVRCIRLRKADRLALRDGTGGQARSPGPPAHEVEQAWFSRTGEGRLDIHVRTSDRRVLSKYEAGTLAWSAWYEFTRGVEIGKQGRAVACPGCGRHRPEPRTSRYGCAGCGQQRRTAGSRRVTVIREARDLDDAEHWKPVVVGQDVGRHRIDAQRAIRLGLPGIDYKKPSIYARPKVLVRKTGIGIKAALDEAGLLTTQVVYHVARRGGSPDLALGYLAGVLSSRCLLAYHLAVSGELEWRSHPYITPKVMRTLPVPDPGRDGSAGWQAAGRIARLVGDMARDGYERATDLRIEALVARMFGLDAGDLDWVAGVLEAADDLEAIRSLRFDPATDLAGAAGGT